MPKRLIEFNIDGDQTVLIEVDEPMEISGGLIPAGLDDSAVAVKASLSFEAAIAKVKPVARAIINQLNELKADEVEVEFGLKLSMEAGAIIASGGVEANYTVKLKWNNAPKQKEEPAQKSGASS